GLSEVKVQPRNQKYFCFRPTQISSLIRTVSSHQRGDRASSRPRGGMRWTRRRQARRQSQGEMNLVSGPLACRMIGVFAYGEAVSFWHPLLVSSWRRRNQARTGLIEPLIRQRRWQNEFVAGESAE